MKGWIVKLLTICNEVYCMWGGGGGVAGMGGGLWGTGGRGLEINKIKIQKHI